MFGFISLFFFYLYGLLRDLHSFPTRRSSDLTMKSRRGFAIQRLMNAMRQAHADGWFIVFDTLTLADDRLEAFYDNPMLCVTIFVILVVWFLLPRVARLMIHTPTAIDRKSGSAGMPRPISYAVFCLKKKKITIFDKYDSTKLIIHVTFADVLARSY